MAKAHGLPTLVFGAGKVGRALASALRHAGWSVSLRAARAGWPRKVTADIVVLALRDRALHETVEHVRTTRNISKKSVVVHVAGALRSDVLAPLRELTAGVAQMHPMISFASTTFFPTLARGNVHIEGDPVAMRRAAKLARAIGMTPRHFPGLDTVGYHAAAALLANGGAALAAQAVQVLVASNVPQALAPKLLGPLLRSVADNVETLGLPAALTGPIRRGDTAAVIRGGETLAHRAPEVLPFYQSIVAAQVPLARALREVSKEALDAIERWANDGFKPG